MSTSIDMLGIRKTLGRDRWQPPQLMGPDGWSLVNRDRSSSVIVTCADWDHGDWVHASIAHTDRDPTYAELTLLHRAVWQGRGFAYQVFAPDDRHINIHEHALHLWGRLDGYNALPDFSEWGTI
jgi:hypothetical protein